MDEIQMPEPNVCNVKQRTGIVCRLFFRVVYGSALLAFCILVVAVFMELWLLFNKIFLVPQIYVLLFGVCLQRRT
jgi:hypothetical protein